MEGALVAGEDGKGDSINIVDVGDQTEFFHADFVGFSISKKSSPGSVSNDGVRKSGDDCHFCTLCSCWRICASRNFKLRIRS